MLTPASGSRRRRHAATLLVFALVYVLLEVGSYTRESATWDEPVHVMDGYLSLVRGDFRADVEHPPLMRMWAALPLVTERVVVDPDRIDQESGFSWAVSALFPAAHRFMYVDNDADALLYRARFMTVLLGVALGAFIYAWAVELFGWAVAVAVLALFVMEPNLASHARLVTTDMAVTLTVFGAVYFCWRVTTNWTRRGLAALAAFAVASILVKFSGLLVAPVLAVLLTAAVTRRRITPRRAAGVAALLVAAGLAGIWACYGFRYLPSENPTWRYRFHVEPFARRAMPMTTAMVEWVDDRRLLPNAYSEGLLLNQARSQQRKAYLAGAYSDTGWWYYFPVAFALKTPTGLIVLSLLGAGVIVRRRHSSAAYVLVPIVIFTGAAVSATINIGVRHLLPIYPFVVLLAGAALHALFTAGRRGGAVTGGLLLAAGLLEPAVVYPHTIAFFNVLAGGPSHGSEYLVDSNVDWGQDLKSLKQWMVDHDVAHINLAYFGFADPRYYGIDCTFLPGSPTWVPAELITGPQLPGYVAVSATLLRGVYASTPAEREFYSGLARVTPVATIGYSIFVYKMDPR